MGCCEYAEEARRWTVLLFTLYDECAQHSEKQKQIRNSGRVDERESRGRSETDRHFHFRGDIALFFPPTIFSGFDHSLFLHDYDEYEGGRIMTISTLTQLVP